MKKILMLLVLACATAHAQDQVRIDPAQLAPDAKRTQVPATATLVPARTPEVPNKLAQASPPAQRAQAAAMYEKLLAAFPQLAAKVGVDGRDAGGALALYIGASYQVLTGATISDPTWKVLVEQMRGALAATPAFTNASLAHKQDFYETTVIVGMMMAVQAANPKAITAETRAQAANYLETFLQTSVKKLTITERGLSVAPADARTPEPTVPTQPIADSGNAAAVAGSIYTVGFDTQAQMGVGGYFYYNPVPIVLFKNGDAADIDALSFAGGIEAHRAKHPKQWTKWRKAGKGFEKLGKKGWSKLSYTTQNAPLPKGWKLDGAWQSIGGGGNTAYGGGTTIAATSALHFHPDGTFSGQRSAGAITPGVTTHSKSGSDGTYEIDGYLLRLRYSDGQVVTKTIVADKEKTPRVVWIDGSGYTKSKK